MGDGDSRGGITRTGRTVRGVIELEYDDVDAAFAESVGRLVRGAPRPDAGVDAELVARRGGATSAELGVLGLATPEGGGTVTTIAAAMEALGSANAPGPLVETFVAVQLLDERRAPRRGRRR